MAAPNAKSTTHACFNEQKRRFRFRQVSLLFNDTPSIFLASTLVNDVSHLVYHNTTVEIEFPRPPKNDIFWGVFYEPENRMSLANANQRDKNGRTALHRAASDGDIASVKQLLTVGTDVNAKSAYGTALHFACEQGSLEIVQLLVAAGADIDAQDGEG